MTLQYLTLPEFQTGDLVSASRLNLMLDNLDICIGLDEQRIIPFDAGANISSCTTYPRPAFATWDGIQTEYWIAHNGDRLWVWHNHLQDPGVGQAATLYYDYGGDNQQSFAIPASATDTPTKCVLSTATFARYEPIKIRIEQVGGGDSDLFPRYIWQTDSNAPNIETGTLPAFGDGTTSSAADFNRILSDTAKAYTSFNQPIPMTYMLGGSEQTPDGQQVGNRSGFVGWVQHRHDRFFADMTVTGMAADDMFWWKYNDVMFWASTAGISSYDGQINEALPAPLVEGNWYKVEFGYTRTTENEQRVKLWAFGETPENALSSYDGNTRWTHGDTANGDSGDPALFDMVKALDHLDTHLRYTNVPCRQAGQFIHGEGIDPCGGGEELDAFWGYRVHRWLAYQNATKSNGSGWYTATLQWFTAGRNLQSYTLPTVSSPTSIDLESTPIKPGMWFKLTGAWFGIQIPEALSSYV